jgi:hypothetical protein
VAGIFSPCFQCYQFFENSGKEKKQSLVSRVSRHYAATARNNNRNCAGLIWNLEFSIWIDSTIAKRKESVLPSAHRGIVPTLIATMEVLF